MQNSAFVCHVTTGVQMFNFALLGNNRNLEAQQGMRSAVQLCSEQQCRRYDVFMQCERRTTALKHLDRLPEVVLLLVEVPSWGGEAVKLDLDQQTRVVRSHC